MIKKPEQHKYKVLKSANAFSDKDYADALEAYKALKCGQIIACDALYDVVDPNVVYNLEYAKGKYINSYFVVVKGPTYMGNKCISNAIVLKINSKQKENCQFVLKKGFVRELAHDKSYVSNKSIGLGPNHFKTLKILKHEKDPNREARLSIVDIVILSKSLEQYAADKKKDAEKLQNELETKEHSEKQKIRKTDHIHNCKQVAKKASRNCEILERYASSNTQGPQNINDFQKYRNKSLMNNYERSRPERSREKEIGQGRPYNINNDFRYNNNYSSGRGGYDMSGYNRGGYQQRYPNNYGSQYNQNYRRGRGRGGYGNNSGYNYYK